MDKNVEGGEAQSWPLASGVWKADAESTSYVMQLTAGGRRPADALSIEDWRAALQAGRSARAPATLFPPEFRFCPQSGEALLRPSTPPESGWVPPFGAAVLNTRSGSGMRGLRQTARPLQLSHPAQRRADADSDGLLPLPPPGDYEFISARVGTAATCLLALDPARGSLYALLPHSRRWELLGHEAGGLLAETHLEHADWRCEMVADGAVCRLFIPSAEGLACVTPDLPSLCYGVGYTGGAPALGAPIQFGEQVWAPVGAAAGGIRFVSVDMQGHAGHEVVLAGNVPVLGRVHAPLADGRIALWPCERGQLWLRKQASGKLIAGFQPWPEGVLPAFEFGCPYLSREGTLWQLCFDSRRESYVYLQLGTECPEQEQALAPRLCSGSFNFRFTTKYKNEPWLEPEQGDDGASRFLLLPLLESSHGAVLGLKLDATAGQAAVLNSIEPMRALLVYIDASSEIEFHAIRVAEPGRLRLFVHEGMLWAYHPMLNRLDGWAVQE